MIFINYEKKIGIVLLLLIGTGMLLIPVQSGFYLIDGDEKLHFFPSKMKQIIIGWRHSVELTPWEETYNVLENGDLTLKSTKYKSYGAGTPDTEGVAKMLPDGYIHVTEVERTIPYYSLFYIPISNYYIKVSGQKHLLSNLVPDFRNIQIHYNTIRGYEWLYLKLAKEREDYE